ncbi:MAG: hypothetical protein KGZ58_05395 [Ignavibacteriales bacterium]|nr:hypothetical protein [Ignavibacteriales bacterium]
MLKTYSILKFITILYLLFITNGCKKDSPTSIPNLPIPPSTAGHWVGTTDSILTLSLELSQKQYNISGFGTMTSHTSGWVAGGTISGKSSYPNFSITFYIPQYQPVVITGRFLTPTTISALLNKSGFTDFPITFLKQKK